jgi:hypothetical protein
MNELREQLLDRMIALYGFENVNVVCFAKACGSRFISDKSLELIVKAHESKRR